MSSFAGVLVRAIAALALVGSALACSSTSASPTPFPSLPSGSVGFAAKNTAFLTRDVVAPASVAWTLAFDNQDNLPHNVVIQDASGQTVFASEVFTGPALRTQAAPALAPGSYTFTCAIHSDMKGTLTAG
jgi:plastocyanin